MDNRTRIEDYITRLLVSYHYSARQASIHEPKVRDLSLEALRQQWAISSRVHDFASFVFLNRHQVGTTVNRRYRRDDVIARGAIDSRRTVLERRRTGHPTRIVYQEPFRAYNIGPNRVLAYVLAQADILATRVRQQLARKDNSEYLARANQVLNVLERVRGITPLAALIQEARGRVRPTSRELKQAQQARQPIYHEAAEVYQYLMDIESGVQTTLSELLKDTLVAPLETWRAYELAVGLGVGLGLSEAENVRMDVLPIASTAGSKIVRCGRFSIHWQSQTKYFSTATLTDWEAEESRILKSLGAPLGGRCPDIVVEDHEEQRVVSVIEVKYYTGRNAWKKALREGVGQLQWYVRGYRARGDVRRLMGKSAVAVWRLPETRPVLTSRHQSITPYVTDLDEIQRGLSKWTKTL